MKTQTTFTQLIGIALCLILSVNLLQASPTPLPASISVTTSVTNVTCNGLCNGTATTTVTGGVAPYSYVWSNGMNTANGTGLCAGTYGITVQDANGDTTSSHFTVTQPSALSVAFTYVYMAGNCSDTTKAVVSGGVAPYTYSWHSVNHTSTLSYISSVCAFETDTLTVTDTNGCSATFYATNHHLTAGISRLRTVSCYGVCDGIAAVHATGGTSPYHFQWSIGSTADTIRNLCAGVYNATVYDAAGDSATQSVTITQPSQLTITTSHTSYGGCLDSIFAFVGGGTTPYNYNWGNYNSTSTYLPYACAGQTYNLTVTDGHGCTQTVSVTMPGSSQVNASAHLIQNATCGTGCNGSVYGTANSGTPPYTYLWSNGSATDTISGLCAGTYRLTVIDSLGVTDTSSITVTQVSSITVSLTYHYGTAACADTVTVSASGGTPPYTYYWHHGTATSTNTTIYGICQGDIDTLVVTDSSGCTTTVFATDRHFSANLTVANGIACYGSCNGVLSVQATGGNAPYHYLWSSSPTNTTSIDSSLCAGTYSVTVYDATGDSIVKTTTLTQPNPITITTSYTSYGNCNDTIFAFVGGGALPYNYNWGNYNSTSAYLPYACNGQTYNLTVTDGHGCTQTVSITMPGSAGLHATTHVTQNTQCGATCNGRGYVSVTGGTAPFTYLWSDGSISDTVTGLCAGTYRVTVVDSSGVTDTVSLNIIQQSSIVVIPTYTQNGNCQDTISLSVSGGISPYTYSWSGGATTSWLDSVCFGHTYNVTVTDSAGCSTAISITPIQTINNICYSFDDDTVPVANKEHAFDVYGNGHAGFLQDWHVTSGTPSIYNPTSVPGITPYDGYQYGLIAVCDVNYNSSEGVSLAHNFVQGQTYQVTMAVRNAPYIGASINPIDVNFILLHDTIPYTYNYSTGCSTTPAIPSGSQTVYSMTHFNNQTWQLITFTFTPTANYSQLWFRTNFSTGSTLTTSFFCFDDVCVQQVTTTCNLHVSLGADKHVGCMDTVGAWLNPYITGGSGSHTISWHAVGIPDSIIYYASNASNFTGGTAVVGIPGSYVVDVTDTNGCTASDTVNVYNANPDLQMNAPSIVCLGSPAILHISGTNQVIGWTKYQNGVFTNLNNTTVDLVDTPTVKTYYIAHVYDTSSTGCMVALLSEVDVDSVCNVWPGDANFNGIANNADILTIGLDYANTGPVRTGASLVWVGQPATDWASNTPNGPNQKHADCDGNGVINADDTLAVALNYGLTHSKASSSSSSISPQLYIRFPANYRVSAGQTLNVPIYLGTTNQPVDTIYGISFTVNYDNTLIDTNTAQLSVSGSWLNNNGGNLLKFRKDLYFNGQTPVAITRTNHANTGGGGLLATVSYTMKDDISGKQEIIKYINFSISDVTAIKADGYPINLNYDQSNDSAEVYLYSGIDKPSLTSQLTVYPNPTNQQLIVNNGGARVEEYMVVDLLGNQVMKVNNIVSNITTLDVSDLSQGVYILRARSGNDIANIKFVIAR